MWSGDSLVAVISVQRDEGVASPVKPSPAVPSPVMLYPMMLSTGDADGSQGRAGFRSRTTFPADRVLNRPKRAHGRSITPRG